jgi:L-ascorbate metabolism protein UlaG (beta-lactamase superfamily)
MRTVKRASVAGLIFVVAVCGWVAAEAQQQPAAKKQQARPPAVQPFGAEAFQPRGETTIRWLGNAGFLINSRGTTLMVDPLLEGFDMPLLFQPPILPKAVPRLDAVLITHRDNDHYSVPTCRGLAGVCRAFQSTKLVTSLMQKEGLTGFGHEIGDVFPAGNTKIRLTPADHNYRPGSRKEDDCGFWIETPDGSIWAMGDTRLMEEHLKMAPPDAIFFDFSDNEWHIGLEGAVKLANHFPNAALLLSHWGTVDAPNFSPFNADPERLYGRVVRPERIHVLAPGQPFRPRRAK